MCKQKEPLFGARRPALGPMRAGHAVRRALRVRALETVPSLHETGRIEIAGEILNPALDALAPKTAET